MQGLLQRIGTTSDATKTDSFGTTFIYFLAVFPKF